MHVTVMSAPLLLIIAVLVVGVLHTLVPDHWAPIALIARQQGWSRMQAIRTAAGAGLGHTASTLILAVIVWIAGAVLAQRFGHILTAASSAALVAFGLWMAIAGLRELRQHEQHRARTHLGHAHVHRHGRGIAHRHWHMHHDDGWHAVEGNLALNDPPARIPLHEHEHAGTSNRTALLFILGSSPMVEGIPAFFAAAKYGAVQLVVMAGVFAVSTIATYIALVALSMQGLNRISLGPIEKYGEVISGAFVALIGAVFFFIG